MIIEQTLGAIFMEIWKRQNSQLAYEWHVRNYEKYEPDLPGYIQKKEAEERQSKKDGSCGDFFYRYSFFFKSSISWLIILTLVTNETFL